MNISDIFQITPKGIHDYFTSIGFPIDFFYANCIFYAIIVTVIVIAVYLVIKHFRRFIDCITGAKRWRKRYINKAVGNDYLETIKDRRKKKYIKTRFQNMAPNMYLDPKESLDKQATEDLMSFYLDEVFTTDNTQAFYCILGGSGMGKTTFAVNLVVSYISRYTEKTLPFDIQLLSLSKDDVLSKINSISDKINTILILDALDENVEAVNSYDDFKVKLEKAVSDFRIVIITCRTQFFPDEDNEPKYTIIQHQGRDKGYKKYTKHFIAPFRNKDIDNYLNALYSWMHPFKKRKAKRIIQNCNSLMIRPLLLSYIDLLVKEDIDYNNILDVYDILIMKWIEREVAMHGEADKVEMKEVMCRFSCDLSWDIYQYNRDRGGYFVPSDDFNAFLSNNDFINIKHNFKGRSLVNRDAIGNIKFSHKSFLEYFLAKKLFQESSYVHFNFEGMDMAALFCIEMCKKYMKENAAAYYSYVSTPLNAFLTIFSLENVNFECVKMVYGNIDYIYICDKIQSVLDQKIIEGLKLLDVKTVMIDNLVDANYLERLLDIKSLKKINIVKGRKISTKLLRKMSDSRISIVYGGDSMIESRITNIRARKGAVEKMTNYLFDDDDDDS